MTTALITGAGRGIGKELARQALAKGWNVIGSVRSTEAQRALAEEFPRMAVLQFDVTDHDAVEKISRSVKRPIDILINNAGIIGPDRQSTTDMDFDGFRDTMEINVLAPLAVAQAFLPHLEQGENPRIINISSVMGRMEFATSDRIAYRASKAALNKVVQGLATDLKPRGITCIAMHPGWVRTDMGGASADISVEESAEGILTVAESLALEKTGRFIDWDGQERVW